MGAFGVEIPENQDIERDMAAFDEQSSEAQESSNQETQSEDQGDESLTKEEVKEIMELEKLERFKFDGQEFTPKDLKNAILMRKDYTQKTQEIAEARKYADNFDVDLEKVIQNPDMLKVFKEVYPASYVEKAERILKMAWGDRGNSENPEKPTEKKDGEGLPRHVLERLDKIDRLEKWQLGQEQRIQEEKAEIIEKQLDDWFEDLSGKYGFADPDAVPGTGKGRSQQQDEGDRPDPSARYCGFAHANPAAKNSDHY
jgi:hypothetical protein